MPHGSLCVLCVCTHASVHAFMCPPPPSAVYSCAIAVEYAVIALSVQYS